MARPSLAQLNAEFAQHGFELVKGAGYFYFVDTDNEEVGLLLAGMETTSVYVCHFRHMPTSRWRAVMQDMVVALEAARTKRDAA